MPLIKASIPYDGESTWANRGSGSRTGAIKLITDIGDGSIMKWNGTYWRVMAPTSVYFDTTTVTGDTTGDDQILKQCLLPAGILRAGRKIVVSTSMGKDGSTDAAAANILRIGAAGTTADPSLRSAGVFASGHRAGGYRWHFYVSSSTELTVLSIPSIANATPAYPNTATSTTHPATITTPNIDSSAIYISQSIDLAGTTNAPQGFSLEVTLEP